MKPLWGGKDIDLIEAHNALTIKERSHMGEELNQEYTFCKSIVLFFCIEQENDCLVESNPTAHPKKSL